MYHRIPIKCIPYLTRHCNCTAIETYSMSPVPAARETHHHVVAAPPEQNGCSGGSARWDPSPKALDQTVLSTNSLPKSKSYPRSREFGNAYGAKAQILSVAYILDVHTCTYIYIWPCPI